MSAVLGKNTRPEMVVRKAAHGLGLRFRLHDRNLPGRPDLVLPKWKTVIFVNGCFWHGHEGCRRNATPKSNAAFWAQKVAANVRRDEANGRRLGDLGWRVVTLWECQVRSIDAAASILKREFPKS
jgi:DNA mismatch endonuclease, patch repair protein